MRTYYEFFAGGGMVKAGLGAQWLCLFANDVSAKKADSYITNWGGDHFHLGDVAEIQSSDLPARADLAWASFPCQDLSLAGSGQGLAGNRSGTFWHFWNLISQLAEDRRVPKVVVLENVCGAITSHGGRDFMAICSALIGSGYTLGALVMNATHFVPQSRPRLFIIGHLGEEEKEPSWMKAANPHPAWHPKSLVSAYAAFPEEIRRSWVWWNLPDPPERRLHLSEIIEDHPEGVDWHAEEETSKLLSMMSPVNLRKVRDAQAAGGRHVGTVYRRTRTNGKNAEKVQRAEIRLDGVAGCLRTPSGGSSRQIIMVIEGESIRSRLLSPREAARLMGLPEDYVLPAKVNDAYYLAGDGVVVPVVRFLAKHLLEPLLESHSRLDVLHGMPTSLVPADC